MIFLQEKKPCGRLSEAKEKTECIIMDAHYYALRSLYDFAVVRLPPRHFFFLPGLVSSSDPALKL